MNDGEVDRAGDIVVAAGVDTTYFRSNPIALLQHDPSKPIGVWTNVHAEGGKLKGTLNVAPTRLGEYVRENIAHGVLKAASIGFVPKAFEPIKNGGFRFTAMELMETSVVALPASRGSLRERGLDTDEERREALEEIMAKQCRLDEMVASDERKRQERLSRAAAIRAEAKANRDFQERLAKTSHPERQAERRDRLERIRGAS